MTYALLIKTAGGALVNTACSLPAGTRRERKRCANCKYSKAVGKDLICGNSQGKMYNITVGKNVCCLKWEEKENE